jgi:hypothetical protein
MIVSLLTGRKGSKGFPNKHFCKVNGHELAHYPMMAAIKCKEIDFHYLSTDDNNLSFMAKKNNIEIIERPSDLASDEAKSEDVFIHGYNMIKSKHKEIVEIIVLLMCNAATISSSMISYGIKVLKDNPDYDSAVTVSSYNMWSPIRARKIGKNGLLEPFVPLDKLENYNNFYSGRNSQGDVWFADMGVSVVRSRCIENMDDGILPQKWMGRKIFPLKQNLGLDVDYKWQIPQVKEWMNSKYNG